MKFQIAKTTLLKESLIKRLSKLGDLKEENDLYIFTDVKNEDLFIYEIAKELNDIGFKTYFKKVLKDNKFDSEQIKRIYKNHEDKTFEFNYFEFILKTKLFLYFLNDNILNITSFLKFNAKDYIDEVLKIAELEVDLNGELLEDDENNIPINDSDTKRFEGIINLIKHLLDNSEKKQKYEDFHIYNSSDKFKIVSELGKEINFKFKDDVDKLYSELSRHSEEPINYDLFLLSIKIGYFQPSRIILYKSLESIPDYFDVVLKDFGLMKQIIGLNTEVFKSSEDKPRL